MDENIIKRIVFEDVLMICSTSKDLNEVEKQVRLRLINLNKEKIEELREKAYSKNVYKSGQMCR